MVFLWLTHRKHKAIPTTEKRKMGYFVLPFIFVFIISGAFVTRYISYEGMMPIRRSCWKSVLFRQKTFFVDGDYKGDMRRKVLKTSAASPLNNSFYLW
jgi:hypothetical protein